MSHFYNAAGTPVYEVERSDGKGMRPTHIGDARKLGLNSGVTGIIGQLDKPGLIPWMNNILLDTILHSSAEIPKQCYNTDGSHNIQYDQWKKTILIDYNVRKELASGKAFGTQIHNELEQLFLTGEANSKNQFALYAALEEIKKALGDAIKIAIPEKSFSHPDGYGGKVDLSGRYLPWNQGGFVIDFKTKNKNVLDKSCATIEHCMQVAAYRKGLDLPKAKCYNLYISATKPGIVYMHEWKEAELLRAEKMFYCLLNYWKLANKL